MQFEASQRKCSACGETGHNARTCKSKVVPFSTGGYWKEKTYDGKDASGFPVVDASFVAMISKVIDGEVLKEPNSQVRIPNITWKEEPITMTWGELDEKCKTQNLVSIGESMYSGAYLRGALAYLPKNTVLTLYTGYHYPLKATFEYGGEEWIFFLAPRVENHYAETEDDDYPEYEDPLESWMEEFDAESLDMKNAQGSNMIKYRNVLMIAIDISASTETHGLDGKSLNDHYRKIAISTIMSMKPEEVYIVPYSYDIEEGWGGDDWREAIKWLKNDKNLQPLASTLPLDNVLEHLEQMQTDISWDGYKNFTTMILTDIKPLTHGFNRKNYKAEGESEYECQVCGKPADYNFQDATIRWKIVNDEFSGNPKVSEYAGQEQNDFYCQEHADEMETGEFYAESLKFKEWADQEMMTHGGRESFQDWLDDEVSSHGNTSLEDWGEHEIASHEARYEAETLREEYERQVGEIDDEGAKGLIRCAGCDEVTSYYDEMNYCDACQGRKKAGQIDEKGNWLYAETLSMKNLGAVAVGGALGIALVGLFTGKNLLTDMTSKLSKASEAKKDCHSCNTNGSVRKNQTQVLSSEYSVGQINPVEVEGQQDIHGAEGVNNPRFAPSPSPAPHRAKSSKWL